MKHLERSGFAVTVDHNADLNAIKAQHQIPAELQTCHTAIVDGYIIEGHVPAADIARLLKERPPVRGLAVPGMPIGSPGMETEGVAPQPFDVLTFDSQGQTQVFSSN